MKMTLESEFTIKDLISPIVEEKVLQCIRGTKPDVGVMDVEVGIHISPLITQIASIKQAYPSTDVVVLLDRLDRLLISDIIDAGARSCLMKAGLDVHSLSKAINEVSNGHVGHSQEVLDWFFDQNYHPLEPQDLDFLRLVQHGLTNKQIASRLKISVGTVKKHLSLIYAKLGVSQEAGNLRMMAVEKARRLGFL